MGIDGSAFKFVTMMCHATLSDGKSLASSLLHLQNQVMVAFSHVFWQVVLS